MKSKIKSRVIKCPVQNRLVEVSYKAIGSWFNREYDIQSCPAMNDWGGCDRQCQRLFSTPSRAAEWRARF